MKKKLLIELFVYITVFIIGVTMLLINKPDKKPIEIKPQFNVGEEFSTYKINGKLAKEAK